MCVCKNVVEEAGCGAVLRAVVLYIFLIRGIDRYNMYGTYRDCQWQKKNSKNRITKSIRCELTISFDNLAFFEILRHEYLSPPNAAYPRFFFLQRFLSAGFFFSCSLVFVFFTDELADRRRKYQIDRKEGSTVWWIPASFFEWLQSTDHLITAGCFFHLLLF